MSLLAKFTIPIEPKSLQFSGKRMMVRNGQVRFFKTSEATRYQGAIAAFAHPYTPETPTEEPLIVDFLFILPRPQRFNTKSHHPSRILADKRPDLDNLVKGTQDALKAFWKDDAQIVSLYAQKFLAAKDEKPHIEVTISTL